MVSYSAVCSPLRQSRRPYPSSPPTLASSLTGPLIARVGSSAVWWFSAASACFHPLWVKPVDCFIENFEWSQRVGTAGLKWKRIRLPLLCCCRCIVSAQNAPAASWAFHGCRTAVMLVILQAPKQGHSHSHDAGHSCRTAVMLVILQAPKQGHSHSHDAGHGWRTAVMLVILQAPKQGHSHSHDTGHSCRTAVMLVILQAPQQGHSHSHDTGHSCRTAVMLVILQAPKQGHSHSHDTGHSWRTAVMLVILQAPKQGHSHSHDTGHNWRTNSVGCSLPCVRNTDLYNIYLQYWW